MIPLMSEELSTDRLIWRTCQVSKELVNTLELGRSVGTQEDNDNLITADSILSSTLHVLFFELDALGIEFTSSQNDMIEDNHRINILVTLREKFDGELLSETITGLSDEHRTELSHIVELVQDGTLHTNDLITSLVVTFRANFPLSTDWELLYENIDLYKSTESFLGHVGTILELTPEKAQVQDSQLPLVTDFIQDSITRRARYGGALTFLNNTHQLLTDMQVELLTTRYDRDKLALLTSTGISDADDDIHHGKTKHHFEYYQANFVPYTLDACMNVVSAMYSLHPYDELKVFITRECARFRVPPDAGEFMQQLVVELSTHAESDINPLPGTSGDVIDLVDNIEQGRQRGYLPTESNEDQ